MCNICYIDGPNCKWYIWLINHIRSPDICTVCFGLETSKCTWYIVVQVLYLLFRTLTSHCTILFGRILLETCRQEIVRLVSNRSAFQKQANYSASCIENISKSIMFPVSNESFSFLFKRSTKISKCLEFQSHTKIFLLTKLRNVKRKRNEYWIEYFGSDDHLEIFIQKIIDGPSTMSLLLPFLLSFPTQASSPKHFRKSKKGPTAYKQTA